MDEFEIIANGITYTIHPVNDGSFKIYDGDDLIGTIEPQVNIDGNLEWTSPDLLTFEMVQTIGQAIEMKER